MSRKKVYVSVSNGAGAMHINSCTIQLDGHNVKYWSDGQNLIKDADCLILICSQNMYYTGTQVQYIGRGQETEIALAQKHDVPVLYFDVNSNLIHLDELMTNVHDEGKNWRKSAWFRIPNTIKIVDLNAPIKRKVDLDINWSELTVKTGTTTAISLNNKPKLHLATLKLCKRL